jgi:Fic-DOC domain mobile mystery protein B
MGLKLDIPEGATPLDPDHAAGLRPSHITTQGQLNTWELANIARGEVWVFARRRRRILEVEFLRRLHRKMFGDTWSWAGQIRTRGTLPVGIEPAAIRPELSVLLADVKAQMQHRRWEMDEIAARFHHRLVYIHPFPNGNGRFARTMTDVLLFQHGHERFAWGADLQQSGLARDGYIRALQAADKRDYEPLFRLLGVGRSAPTA